MLDRTPESTLLQCPLRVAVLGAGAWGTTLATLARDRGHQVQVWSRQGKDHLETVLAEADLVISAISMKGVRSVVEQVQSAGLAPHCPIVTATKGLDPNPGDSPPHLPSQIWQLAFPAHSIVVLSGPNLSQEIQQGLPAATVVASAQAAAATTVQFALSSPSFRVYTNPDALGVELGGTLKNVMAIAVGACDGLGLGTNAKSALTTRGLAEIIRIGSYWGAKPETFFGLSGLGDLMATCNSALSRNYQVGYRLGQGWSLAAVLAALQGTAEGLNTTEVLVKLATQQQISIPITQQVDRLLKAKVTPQAALEALMLREYKPELD
ncbi:MAG TPA: NAD(P)H-dependent glycerol-3-phosphate dehydrogenase [Thermosynechococcaceae cyanobacterium]